MRRCSLSTARFRAVPFRRSFAVPLVFTLSLLSSPCVAGVVINEVLYDPEGTDTGLEFVEILNCGRTTVSLAGWTLETGNGANPDDWTVEWIGGDFDVLEPGGFLVIGEASVVPEPDFVTPLDLQNGPDGARLTDGTLTVDVVGWGEPLFNEYYEGAPAADVPSGNSLARSPDCYDHDDNSLDFLAAGTPTPGSGNSAGVDLGVSVRHAGNHVFGPDGVSITCVVRNDGALEVSGGGSSLGLFLDGAHEPDLVLEVAETLAPRDTLDVRLEFTSESGYHRAAVRVTCPGDEDPENDLDETSFAVGGPGGQLRLSEIMYSPDDGDSEWVEFRNVSLDTTTVAGWSLGDDDEQHTLLGASPVVERVAPNGAVVVARDTTAMGSVTGCAVLASEGWEALSAGDVVVLLDAFGTPVERVAYDDAWGGERGVSLERVRIDAAPEDPCNWGSSVAPSGSTPCRENSINLPAQVGVGLLKAYPNPFTPDGDGRSDRTAISYELPVARATVKVSVYDAVGRKRVTLAEGDASSSGELLWDGCDDAGLPLPSGLYVVRLQAINAREGVLVDEKRAVGLVR